MLGKLNNKAEDRQKELCKPYIMPFVNESWAGVSFSDNLNKCMTEQYDNLFGKSIAPLIKTFGSLNEVIMGQGNMISQLTSSLAYFKEQIKTMAEDVYRQIEDIFNTIWELIERIFGIFKKIFDAIGNTLAIGANIGFALATVMNILSPIVNFFSWCFDGDTLIETKTGEKKIKNIKIGDVLSDNSKVIGIQKI